MAGRFSQQHQRVRPSSNEAQIIKRGMDLGVEYLNTHSCYDPFDSGDPCGECDACKLRLKGFDDNGLIDPLNYKL